MPSFSFFLFYSLVCFLHSLINKIKPGTIKRVNRLPTPIAGLVSLLFFFSLLCNLTWISNKQRCLRTHPSSCAVTQSLVVYYFCWFNIWEDDEGEKEMWASVICPATYPSTVINSVNMQQLGACKCSPWCASGCKNIFIIFRKTLLTGCSAGRKWTWIDLCALLLFLWLTACLYLSSWLLNVLCHTGSTKVNTLKVCLQLFERGMIYYSAFTYLSYWVQLASVNVITKSLRLQDNDEFPGE